MIHGVLRVSWIRPDLELEGSWFLLVFLVDDGHERDDDQSVFTVALVRIICRC